MKPEEGFIGIKSPEWAGVFYFLNWRGETPEEFRERINRDSEGEVRIQMMGDMSQDWIEIEDAEIFFYQPENNTCKGTQPDDTEG